MKRKSSDDDWCKFVHKVDDAKDNLLKLKGETKLKVLRAFIKNSDLDLYKITLFELHKANKSLVSNPATCLQKSEEVGCSKQHRADRDDDDDDAGDDEERVVVVPDQQPPELPEKLKQLHKDREVSETVLVIQKKIYSTDVNTSQGRLSMPLRQIKNMEFLSEEEKDLLSERGGIAVKLIDLADKNCEVYNVTLKQWKLKYTSNYCLVTGWNTFLTKNRLEVDTTVQAAEEDLAAVKAELSSNQTKRWQALGMLRNIFLCVNLPWELKKQAINFLLCIVDGNVSHEYNNEHVECSIYMPSLFATLQLKETLQAVEMVVIYAPDAVLRRNAFDALKKVLADIPTSLRFDTLMALIKNTDSSSMIAILIDCVRKEMHMENCQRISIGNEVIHAQNNACFSAAFWNAGALELVELILRPTLGMTCIPPRVWIDQELRTEYTNRIDQDIGNTNYTGVLSKKNLQKAYKEWLLPLQTVVTGIVAENKKDYDRLAMDTVCVLNPVELVLYHCIELVEEKLKNAT
ncbi:unnamed protein product [Camellia sinensis]